MVGVISAVAAEVLRYGAGLILFGQPFGFAIVAATIVADAVVIAALFRSITGRARPIAAIMLALLPAFGVGIGIITSGQFLVSLVFGGPASVVIGASVGGLSMLALPGWWRLAGAMSAVVIAIPLTVPLVADAVERAAEAEREHRESLEQEYENLVDPLSTSLPGATTELVSVSNDVAFVAVTRDGRELVIQTTPTGGPGTYDPDAFECWRLVGTQSFEGTETLGDFAGRCTVIDGGWATTDGSMVGTNVGTRWVQVEAGAGATSDEVLAVFRSLEELPDQELRAWFEAQLVRRGSAD